MADISGVFYIYTRKYDSFKAIDVGIEERQEEANEIHQKIDEKYGVVREKQQELTFNMQEEAQKTTVDDIFADDEERPW